MIGLRRYDRDASLPSLAGQPDLAPLPPEELRDAVEEHSLRSAHPPVESLRWEYARWRPGESTCSAYTVRFADGEERILVAKQSAADRCSSSNARGAADRILEEWCDRLRPRVVVPDRNLVLWGFPADRALLGHALMLDQRALARLIEDAGLALPRSVRRRRLACELLRYKPEHRSVWRVEVPLREGDARSLTVAVRILRPEQLRRTVAARVSPSPLAGKGDAPAVLTHALREGLLVEEWLDVETFAPDHFAHAAEAGAVLALLHGRAMQEGPTTPGQGSVAGLRPLFAVDRDLVDLAPCKDAAVDSGLRAWIHGDFHPDQVARGRDGAWKLLDLDLVGIGDPLRDLAGWVADHVAETTMDDWHAAAAPLLAGYAGGGGMAVDQRRLRAHVADALVRRAAGAVRRLEQGAVAKAKRLLLLAASLRGPAPAPRRRSPLDDALERTAVALGRTDATDVVERVDVRPRTGLVVSIHDDGRRRWFRLAGTAVEELTPAEDRRVPLARRAGNLRLLAYRPGRRVVLEDMSGARPTIHKGYRRGKSQAAAAAHLAAERANAGGGFLLPHLLEHRGDEETLVLERFEGASLPLGVDAVDHFRRIGEHLASFQAGTVPEEVTCFGCEDELEVLDTWALRVGSVVGKLPSGWRTERERLGAFVDPSAPTSFVPCHRDLHDRQLLVTERGLALFDFDLFCRADSALDPANLLAHLGLRRRQGVSRDGEVGERACRAALLDGLGAGGPTFAARLAFYEATSCLRLALVYSIRPRWWHLSSALVEAGRQNLDEWRRLGASPHMP